MAAPGGGPGPFAGWSAPAEWSSFCASSLHPTDVSLHEGRRLSTSSYESSGAARRAGTACSRAVASCGCFFLNSLQTTSARPGVRTESVLAYLIEDEEEEEEAGQAHAYPLAPAQAEPALPHTAARLAQAPPASPPCAPALLLCLYASMRSAPRPSLYPSSRTGAVAPRLAVSTTFDHQAARAKRSRSAQAAHRTSPTPGRQASTPTGACRRRR